LQGKRNCASRAQRDLPKISPMRATPGGVQPRTRSIFFSPVVVINVRVSPSPAPRNARIFTLFPRFLSGAPPWRARWPIRPLPARSFFAPV